MTNDERKRIEKIAKEKGYDWNSKGTKLINGHGGSVVPSKTGNSITINGKGPYNNPHDTEKSTGW